MNIRMINRCASGIVLGALLLTTACERNNEVDPERLISVCVTTPSIRKSPTKELSLVPSFAERTMETIALEGGLLLDVSWEAGKGSGLRASALESGKKFRVVALNAADGTYVSHGDFEVGGATSVPSLHVLENISHDFICISHNSDGDLSEAKFTVGEVAELEILSVGSGDLLYGKMTKAITASDRELRFVLEHCLSQIKLTVDHSYNEWSTSSVTIGGIMLYPFYAGATMKLQDWSLLSEGGAPLGRYFSNWAASSLHTQSCDVTTVFGKDEEMSIIIPQGAITVQGKSHPSVEQRIRFSAFASGTSYDLRLKIRLPRWAGSNIYWDTGEEQLTFDLEGQTQNQNFQGVFFRWGSLVGISPARVGASNNFTNSVLLYVPNYNAGDKEQSTWTFSTPTPYSAWNSFSEGYVANDTVEIPYMDGRAEFSGALFGRTSTFVIDAERNTPAVYAGLRGDICQYLGKTIPSLNGYRLPTSLEFGTTNGGSWGNRQDGWEKEDDYTHVTNTSLGNPEGTSPLLNIYGKSGHAKNTHTGDVIFPISGNRSAEKGALSNVGNLGRYATGSIASAAMVHILSFDKNGITFNASTNRGIAVPVRCVKK
jgi:hypothetical protein